MNHLPHPQGEGVGGRGSRRYRLQASRLLPPFSGLTLARLGSSPVHNRGETMAILPRNLV